MWDQSTFKKYPANVGVITTVTTLKQHSTNGLTPPTLLPLPPQFVQKTRAVFVEPTAHVYRQHDYQSTPFLTQSNPQFSPYNGYAPVQYPYRQEQQFQNYQPRQQYFPNHINNQFHEEPQIIPEIHSIPPDPFTTVEPMETTTVQPKEQILEEIVRECEEIERRSNSSASPVSNWSSDDRDTPSVKSFHPYKTPEKKERKKAQNRLAATRYREKKRREKEEALTCIEGLTVTNLKLKDQVSELEREVRYFKKFMQEMGMKNAV
ncbi:hypothetical protein L3Y34_013339 [Caenorhabditis briggsae]|uniref:BZIP domain-containing protein n=2 Tax=Caenorhabditis briggsae TaxID=6238 RepID=A0AAE8ZWP2_CAEBR|nr:hypothetical protein L3Y34_013339 [Caenorhabditis briggsae]